MASAVYGELEGGGSTRGGAAGGYWEGYYTGTTPPTHIPVYWYCQGPTNGQIRVFRHPQALRAPAGPSAHLLPGASLSWSMGEIQPLIS